MSRGQGLVTSLRCFQHPLTWLSIALLLLNDHVLKTLAPSWLTGKLSDLAGLFFFPLFVAAGLGFFLDRLHAPVRLTGAVSFALTGASFVLLKTVPAANALAARVATAVLGTPVGYALDPTDLLALAALLPAWWLWNHPPAAAPRRAARVALVVGALASLATSPQEPPLYVDRVASANGVLYATSAQYGGTVRSDDGGMRWVKMVEAEPPGLFHDVVYPFVACDPAAPRECFRITGAEAVEASTDGGASWRVDWSIPAGRREFMQRYSDPEFYGIRLAFVPLDLAFFEYEGNRYLLVAMGEEGIMRRRLPDGGWERRTPTGGSPTPYATTDYVLTYVRWEVTIALVLSQLALLGVGFLVWRPLRERLKSALAPPRSAGWVMRPLVVLALISVPLVLLCSVVPFLWFLFPDAGLIGLILLGLGLAPLLIGLVIATRRITSALQDPRPVQLAVRIGLLTAGGVLVAGTLPWVLWVDGTIPHYTTALLIVVPTLLAILGGGLASVWAVARKAAGPG